MYEFLLVLHSYNRWLVLLLALVVLFRSFSGWQGRKAYTKPDNIFHAAFVGLIHLQLLTGLLLYFVYSPVMQQIFSDFGGSMKNASLRFWAVEHIAGMLIGTVLAQLGRTLSKKVAAPELKHKRAFIYTLIALVIIFLSIPFGITNQEARPLFR